jgi:hypothetical protein
MPSRAGAANGGWREESALDTTIQSVLPMAGLKVPCLLSHVHAILPSRDLRWQKNKNK